MQRQNKMPSTPTLELKTSFEHRGLTPRCEIDGSPFTGPLRGTPFPAPFRPGL